MLYNALTSLSDFISWLNGGSSSLLTSIYLSEDLISVTLREEDPEELSESISHLHICTFDCMLEAFKSPEHICNVRFPELMKTNESDDRLTFWSIESPP